MEAALQKRGYLRVCTPVLLSSAGTDPEIEPMAADYAPRMETVPPAKKAYLHTSPEFPMKRLLCRGMKDIFQICPAFRQGEKGTLHSPEFTIAEWYRVGAGHNALMDELEAVLAEVLGGRALVGGEQISLAPPLPRAPFAEAMIKAGAGQEAVDACRAVPATARERLSLREAIEREYVSKMEPWLAGQGALFLVDWPPSMAVLAEVREDQGVVSAERFELIVGGIEIANGCSELADPAEHRRRFSMDNAERELLGRAPMPLPAAFLSDLEEFGLPECAGLALGVERLAMLATGSARADDLIAGGFLD